MNGRKVLYYVGSGIFILLISIMSFRYISAISYRRKIPQPTEDQINTAYLKEQFDPAYKRAYHNPSADNLGMLGMLYHSIMSYAEAEQCYKLAIRKDEKKWLWSYYLGYLNRESGDSEESIGNFQRVISENPDMYLVWYYEANGYQNLGKNDEAEERYKKIVNAKPGIPNRKENLTNDFFPLSIYARFQLARIYINTQRYDLASETLAGIINSDRTFGPAYRLLGNVYSIKGDTLSGKEFIMRANDLTDNTTPSDNLIDGISLISRSDKFLLKQIDEAESRAHPEFALVLAKNGLKYLPGNKYLISKTVKLLLNMNYGNQSLPFLDRHIEYFKDDFKEIKEVANLLYDRNLYSQSLKYNILASELNSEDAEIQSNIVLCLWKMGEKEQASARMNSLVLNNENNIKMIANAVYVMFVLGEKDLVNYYLRRLNKISPHNPRVLLLAGMVAEGEGNLNKALMNYEQSFRGNPMDMATAQALGNLYVRQKMLGKAINHYRRALEYFPNEPFLLEKTGTLLITCPDQKLRNIDEGLKYSERAFIHKGSTPDITIAAGKSIGIAYAARNDYKTAYSYIEMALNGARTHKAPVEYIAELERLLIQYNALKK